MSPTEKLATGLQTIIATRIVNLVWLDISPLETTPGLASFAVTEFWMPEKFAIRELPPIVVVRIVPVVKLDSRLIPSEIVSCVETEFLTTAKFATPLWSPAHPIAPVVPKTTFPPPAAVRAAETASLMPARPATPSTLAVPPTAAVAAPVGFPPLTALDPAPSAATVFWTRENDVTQTRTASSVRTAELLTLGHQEAFACFAETVGWTSVRLAMLLSLAVPVTVKLVKMDGSLS